MKEITSESITITAKKNNIGMLAVIMSLFLAAVDSTIVSTVLPTISHQLGHPDLWPWVMSAFLLPVALVAPLAGAFGDRFGVSATLKVFLLIFLGSSVLAGISKTMPMLILARALQGIGAGGIIVLSYSLLAALFDTERRGKMQGMLSGVWGLSAIIGPLLGSVLGASFGWRAIFWINIPIGLIALLLLLITPKVNNGMGKARFDMFAQGGLIVSACCLLLLSAMPKSGYGLISMLIMGLILGLLSLIIRVRYYPEASPIPLAFFQKPTLFPIIVLVLLSSAGLYASVTLLPLALSQHPTNVPTGLLVMLAALGWVVGAAICGTKLTVLGYRRLAAGGMIQLATGSLLMAVAITNQMSWLMAVSLLLIGLGMGFTATATLVLAQNAAPPERLGTWTATIQFLRNMGAALGVNILATIQLHLSYLHAFPTCFVILGASMLVGLMFTILLPRNYSVKSS